MSFPNFPSGQSSSGTLLQRGSGGCPETFTTVGRVGNINGPDMSRAAHKTSSHSTIPAGGGPAYHSYVPGMIEPGKLTFDLFMKTDNSSDRLLLADFISGNYIDWRIVEPDQLGSLVGFNGFLDAVKLEAPADGVTKASCSIKLTGAVYWFS